MNSTILTPSDGFQALQDNRKAKAALHLPFVCLCRKNVTDEVAFIFLSITSNAAKGNRCHSKCFPLLLNNIKAIFKLAECIVKCSFPSFLVKADKGNVWFFWGGGGQK